MSKIETLHIEGDVPGVIPFDVSRPAAKDFLEHVLSAVYALQDDIAQTNCQSLRKARMELKGAVNAIRILEIDL